MIPSIEIVNKIMGRLMYENLSFILKHDRITGEPFIIASYEREWELDFQEGIQAYTIYISGHPKSVGKYSNIEIEMEKIIEEIKTP